MNINNLITRLILTSIVYRAVIAIRKYNINDNGKIIEMTSNAINNNLKDRG